MISTSMTSPKKNNFALLFCLSILLFNCSSEDKQSQSSVKQDSIANIDDWGKLVIGTWKYECFYNLVKEKQYCKGEIEYFPDGTFVRNVTITVFFTTYGEVTASKGYEDIIAGGTVKGKWSIDKVNKKLVEKNETCSISNSHLGPNANKQYDGCSWFNSDWEYGNIKDDYNKTELLEFSDKKIEISQKTFRTNADTSYEATKIE